MNINLFRPCIRAVFFILLVIFLVGCGGGGGDSNQSQGTTRMLLKTSPLPIGNTVDGSMKMTISFPFGIFITDPAADAVKLVGATDPARTVSSIKYTPAPAGGIGTLELDLYDLTGFNGTEYVSIHFSARPGTFPIETDFRLSNFSVWDLNGADSSIPSPTVTFSLN